MFQGRSYGGPYGSHRVAEWTVRVIQGMYSNSQSCMQVNSQCNYEFGTGVHVHQDSALSPWLFIPVLEALSHEFSIRVSPSSRHGRQVWKVKSSMSSPSKPSSWSLVLAMLSSRNLANAPVLPALVVSAATQSSAHSACGGSTRSAVASLNNCWPLQTMSAAGVRVRLSLSMAELWMSMAPCLMWKPLSATYVISCTPVPLLPDHMLCGPGNVQENLSVLTARYLSPRICGKVHEACVSPNNQDCSGTSP